MPRLSVPVMMLAAVSLAAAADDSLDWPKFHGPRGDNICAEPGLATQWPAGGPKKLWSVEVGLGHSSPVAVGNRIYIAAMPDKRTETLTCIDAATGRQIWTQRGTAGWTANFVGTRATPTIEGEHIYTFSGQGVLICRNLADGVERWKLDVLKATGGRNIRHGVASSPHVVGDRVFVQGGDGGSIALCADKRTGHVIWKSAERGVSGYATTVMIDVEDSKQLIAFTGERIVALDPANGKTLWRYDWPAYYWVNAATPVFRDGHLLITSGYKYGAILLRPGARSATRVWQNKDLQGRFPTPILDGNHLYGNSEGTLVCLRRRDGKLAWSCKDGRLRLGFGGSFVRFGEHLVTLSDSGKLSLVKATPATVELISQVQLFRGSEIWSTPVIHQRRLYVKGPTELICLDVAEAPNASQGEDR